MKVFVVEDEYDFFLSKEPWYTEPSIEIDEKDWDDYCSYENLRETWQSKMQDWHREAKEKALINSIPKVDYSVPFKNNEVSN